MLQVVEPKITSLDDGETSALTCCLKTKSVIETMAVHVELRTLLNAPGASNGRANVSNAARVLSLWDFEHQQSAQVSLGQPSAYRCT